MLRKQGHGLTVVFCLNIKENNRTIITGAKAVLILGVYSYLIDSYDVVFAHAPTRVDGDELFINEFCYSACNGMSLDSTLARALKLSRVLGSCFIIMDTPEDPADNYEQMIADRSYPYLEIVLPQSVTTLEIDRKGDIIKFGYKYETERERFAHLYPISMHRDRR